MKRYAPSSPFQAVPPVPRPDLLGNSARLSRPRSRPNPSRESSLLAGCKAAPGVIKSVGQSECERREHWEIFSWYFWKGGITRAVHER